MILHFEITGLDQIEADIRRRTAEFERRAETALRQRSAELVTRTANRAPEDDGFLRGAVRSIEFSDPGVRGFVAGWFEDDFRAAGEDVYYLWTEYGTSKMEPRPALGPSWEETAPLLVRDLEAAFAESFR